MTDEQITERFPAAAEPAAAEPVDEKLDTTDGTRDPLTTDEGLAAAAENMPAVDEARPVDETTGGQPAAEPVATPELDVADDGTDPTAELARPGDDKEV